MAYTTINKHTEHFNTKLYTGNGSTQSITGVGFQPDWLWIKSRGSTGNHRVHDVVRGVDKQLYPNLTSAEYTYSPNTGVTNFDSDGFSLGSDIGQNTNNETYASWNWKAGNSAGSSNTDGTITSTVSANTTAGFSIVKWTGDSSASATVGHGLGTTPALIISKEMNGTDYWHVYHKDLTANYNLFPNTNSAETNPSDGTLANVGSSTFGFQGSTNVVAVNETGIDNIAYCFAEKTGYSKFGKVNGNGNADGPFVYTGFAPSFVLYKKINAIGDWYFVDNKRPGYNDNDKRLYSNTNQAEETYDLINLYSNGFKLTNSTHTYTNDSAGTYMYMAFGQSLVGSNNVPCTAR
jgi:hypothetical protein